MTKMPVKKRSQSDDLPVTPPAVREFYSGSLLPCQHLWACQNTNVYFPTRTINNGNHIRELPSSGLSLQNLVFDHHGVATDLVDYISANRIAGLLVLKDSEIVIEHYDLGIDSTTRWMSMSMAKSISTTLVGAALLDGYIESVDDVLSKYVPSLREGNYAEVTIRQLMLMSSGVQWNEDHTNPNSNRSDVLGLQIGQQAGSITEYMSHLPRMYPPGECWNYSTGETHIVGELLRAATGKWLADYLSEKIWSVIGMESPAYWWLESKGGLEVAGSGIGATLRDYGRFGLLMQDGGKFNERSILPDWWVTEAAGPTLIGGQEVPYGYMWWVNPSAPGSFTARGIFGQRIHVDPQNKLVMVILAARSKPIGSEGAADLQFIKAATELLSDREATGSI